jgi:hypothetical protein
VGIGRDVSSNSLDRRRARGSLATVRFQIDSIPGGSRLTVRHDGFKDRDACEGHARGWERVLSWLSVFVRGAHLADQ